MRTARSVAKYGIILGSAVLGALYQLCCKGSKKEVTEEAKAPTEETLLVNK